MNTEQRRTRTVSRRDVIVLGSRLMVSGPVLAVAGCGLGGQAYQAVPPDVAATVEMTNDLAFSPAKVTVRAGDIIEWRNKSIFTHTVTADPKLANDPKNVVLPPGASPFHSGDVAPGEVFRVAPEAPGTYRYVCLPHESNGMLGEIEVNPRA